jgi:phosphoglycerate dehydrogenase-like enzyme
VALTCPLTKETEGLIDAQALRAMKPSTFFVNVARGRCVDEAALVTALAEGRIAGAGIDVTHEEPLAASSPLWDMTQVLLTPHTAGETRRYEDTILDYLGENLDRLWRGEARLHNEIV